jgi:predicted site-specific integrase-resolvase
MGLDFSQDMTEKNSPFHHVGYARVSTYGQMLDALEQLRKEGCNAIQREKASGAQATRRELLRMLKALRPGDVVTVTRTDRPARSIFTCLPSSSRSWTPVGNSGHWPSRGPTPPPAPGD